MQNYQIRTLAVPTLSADILGLLERIEAAIRETLPTEDEMAAAQRAADLSHYGIHIRLDGVRIAPKDYFKEPDDD